MIYKASNFSDTSNMLQKCSVVKNNYTTIETHIGLSATSLFISETAFLSHFIPNLDILT